MVNLELKDITIDEDFKTLLPKMTADESKLLEEQLIEKGCTESLKVINLDGKNYLVDGHNRYDLILKLEVKGISIPYKIDTIHGIESKNDALVWIIQNQLGRRNVSSAVKAELALKLKPLLAIKAKERQGSRTDIKPNLAESGQGQVRDELAVIAGVSHGTMDKVEDVLETGSESLKDAMRTKKVSIDAAHTLVSLPKAEQDAIISGGKVKEAVKEIRDRKKKTETEPNTETEPEPETEEHRYSDEYINGGSEAVMAAMDEIYCDEEVMQPLLEGRLSKEEGEALCKKQIGKYVSHFFDNMLAIQPTLNVAILVMKEISSRPDLYTGWEEMGQMFGLKKTKSDEKIVTDTDTAEDTDQPAVSEKPEPEHDVTPPDALRSGEVETSVEPPKHRTRKPKTNEEKFEDLLKKFNLTEVQVEEFVEMHKNGMSYVDIAKEMNLPSGTVVSKLEDAFLLRSHPIET